LGVALQRDWQNVVGPEWDVIFPLGKYLASSEFKQVKGISGDVPDLLQEDVRL
jgi:hypothetical protein